MNTSTSLRNYLLTNHNERLLSVEVRNPVKLKKKGHTFGEIYKTQVLLLLVNKSYTDAVNEQRLKEEVHAEFEAKKTWGTQLAPSLIIHEGKEYIQGILKGYESSATYECDGQPILKSEFEKFMVSSGGGNARQGVKNEIQVRKINLENVVSFEEV